MNVPFYLHNLDSSASSLIANILDTPFLTTGVACKEVEQLLCEFFNVSHAKMANSWTNGAIATLLAMELKPGDEVIVPAMTFIASSNVVEILGAKSVFVDVDPHTLLIDLQQVKNAITKNTKAIIPVHLYGQMVDIKALREIVGKDILIIEDCAHCFEGSYNGSKPGQYSDAAIFSFYATKNITCGEGGAIICNSEELYAKICQTLLHGMSAGAADRFKKGSYNPWDMKMLGTKANLPDLLAVLLPEQIRNVYKQLEIRETLCRRYEDAFANTPIRLQKIEDNQISARHLFPIHVATDKRNDAIKILNEAGVNVTVNYGSVPQYTYYKEKYGHAPSDHPVSYEWGAGQISLPLFTKLTTEQQDYVINTIIEKVVPILK